MFGKKDNIPFKIGDNEYNRQQYRDLLSRYDSLSPEERSTLLQIITLLDISPKDIDKHIGVLQTYNSLQNELTNYDKAWEEKVKAREALKLCDKRMQEIRAELDKERFALQDAHDKASMAYDRIQNAENKISKIKDANTAIRS